MERRKRAFKRHILHHSYQLTADGYLLFYNVSDHLAFFTLFCILARKYDITVLSLCQMPDHIHHATRPDRARQLSDFVGEYTRRFSRESNEVCHRHGPLFESPFGSAVKNGDKKGRSTLLYIGNNPVERRIRKRAVAYRWNYLAYYKNTHPFSDELIIRKASPALRRAVREVDSCFRSGLPLRYSLLQRLFRPIDNRERQQLTDHIISIYNVIDYEQAIRFFGSYEDMIAAMDADTGSEYDINEVFFGKDDSQYARMSAIAGRMYPDVHDALAASPEERFELLQQLMRETRAAPGQIARFLRMRLGSGNNPDLDVSLPEQ